MDLVLKVRENSDVSVVWKRKGNVGEDVGLNV